MLVLTRKLQQQIQIGPDVTITILRVKGQTVRIGVEAPRNVCVLRAELGEKLEAEDASPTVRSAIAVTRREQARTANQSEGADEASSEVPTGSPLMHVRTQRSTGLGALVSSHRQRRLMPVPQPLPAAMQPMAMSS